MRSQGASLLGLASPTSLSNKITGCDKCSHLDEDDTSPAAGKPQQPRNVVPCPLDDVAHGLQVCSGSDP